MHQGQLPHVSGARPAPLQEENITLHYKMVHRFRAAFTPHLSLALLITKGVRNTLSSYLSATVIQLASGIHTPRKGRLPGGGVREGMNRIGQGTARVIRYDGVCRSEQGGE